MLYNISGPGLYSGLSVSLGWFRICWCVIADDIGGASDPNIFLFVLFQDRFPLHWQILIVILRVELVGLFSYGFREYSSSPMLNVGSDFGTINVMGCCYHMLRQC